MLKLHFLLLVNMLKNILKLLNKLMKKDILFLFGVTLCRPVTTACPCVNMAAHKNRHILRAPVPSDAPVSVMSYTAGLLRPYLYLSIGFESSIL